MGMTDFRLFVNTANKRFYKFQTSAGILLAVDSQVFPNKRHISFIEILLNAEITSFRTEIPMPKFSPSKWLCLWEVKNQRKLLKSSSLTEKSYETKWPLVGFYPTFYNGFV